MCLMEVEDKMDSLSEDTSHGVVAAFSNRYDQEASKPYDKVGGDYFGLSSLHSEWNIGIEQQVVGASGWNSVEVWTGKKVENGTALGDIGNVVTVRGRGLSNGSAKLKLINRLSPGVSVLNCLPMLGLMLIK